MAIVADDEKNWGLGLRSVASEDRHRTNDGFHALEPLEPSGENDHFRVAQSEALAKRRGRPLVENPEVYAGRNHAQPGSRGAVQTDEVIRLLRAGGDQAIAIPHDRLLDGDSMLRLDHGALGRPLVFDAGQRMESVEPGQVPFVAEAGGNPP